MLSTMLYCTLYATSYIMIPIDLIFDKASGCTSFGPYLISTTSVLAPAFSAWAIASRLILS
jgi:hypothetical protein